MLRPGRRFPCSRLKLDDLDRLTFGRQADLAIAQAKGILAEYFTPPTAERGNIPLACGNRVKITGWGNQL